MNRKAKEVKPRSEINSLFFFFRSWFKLLCLHFDELSCYSAVHMLLWVSLWTQPEKKKKKSSEGKQNKKTPGVSSESPAPAQVGSVLSPSTISGEVWSVTTQGSKRLNSFRQLEAQYTGSRFSHVSGRRCRQVRYSTSLGLSVLSFLMTGRGWASVLKTQCSNGRWSSSEKRR